jgi:hypothetical protein
MKRMARFEEQEEVVGPIWHGLNHIEVLELVMAIAPASNEWILGASELRAALLEAFPVRQ